MNDNIRFISMSIYPVRINERGKKIISHMSILNYGEKTGNNLKYLTKAGEVVRSISDVESQSGYFTVFKLEEIDLNHLIEDKTNKPVLIDYRIETGVLRQNKFSPIDFLVQEFQDRILIKPILEIIN